MEVSIMKNARRSMMVELTVGKEFSLAYDSIASITMQQIPNGISSPNRIFGADFAKKV